MSEEIRSLEGVDRRLEELQDKINRLAKQLGLVKAWDQDHSDTEDKLVVSYLNIPGLCKTYEGCVRL